MNLFKSVKVSLRVRNMTLKEVAETCIMKGQLIEAWILWQIQEKGKKQGLRVTESYATNECKRIKYKKSAVCQCPAGDECHAEASSKITTQ